MFLDDVLISVRAGAGGDGAATMRREAHVPRGGPDGGDGGRGGSIYLRVDAGQTALHDFRFKHRFAATSGGRGERSKRHGKAGEDLYLAVPPGTAVIDTSEGGLIADLVAVGQEVMVAKGGRGGLGNVHFATATHQAPKHAQRGEPGEERELRLELRLIADVGLVGLPNAGKSTLLAALTAARPKIADYPFTTLEPNLGVMDLGLEDGRRPTIADVPGLIEGASDGAGLGHAFLRHVERTRVLLHLVDGSSRDPTWDHEVIREELLAHDPALLAKPMVTVFNKMDLMQAREAWPAFEAAMAAGGLAVRAISATDGEGLDALRDAIGDLLPDAASFGEPPEPAGVVVHRLEAAGDGFTVEVEDRVFQVKGKRIERLAVQTNFENEESAGRFQRELVRLGRGWRPAQGWGPAGRHGPDRRHGAGMGAAGGGSVTDGRGDHASLSSLAPLAEVTPPAPLVPGSTGVLGGTFDPIHHGHLVIAEEARETLGLERVLFVPAATPPHKPGRPVTDAARRMAMVELAIADNPSFRVSVLEVERGGASYTVDTLEALRDQGISEPWFILSAEALAGLPTWRDPERILVLCRLAVVPRAGYEPLGPAWVAARFPGLEDRVTFLPGPLLPISGSVVRRRAAAGRSVRYLVPDPVARYIADQHLYLDPSRRIQTT